ncbi:MAG: polysaccharide deacetylase family protein [Gammaproteobacteria bacterium]|nr:polysaccharide deacetylase family protein [Gammaproteobacteria bacterium]
MKSTWPGGRGSRVQWVLSRRALLGAGMTLAAGGALAAASPSGIGGRGSGSDLLGNAYRMSSGRVVSRIPDLKWPEGVRCVVNVTLDYDAQMARVSNKEPRLEATEGEFGGRVGIWRLLDVCSENDVGLTLFLPGRIADLYPSSVQEAARRGFEFADHSWDHPAWAEIVTLDRDQQREHLRLTMERLQSISGKPVIGSRWFYALEDLVDNGILYESMGLADDMPYFVTEQDRSVVVLPLGVEHNDAMYWKFAWLRSEPQGQRIADAQSVGKIWLEAFREVHERGGYLNILLHDAVGGRASRVAMLDKLFKEMRNAGGVWFATCGDVARYCHENYAPGRSG